MVTVAGRVLLLGFLLTSLLVDIILVSATKHVSPKDDKNSTRHYNKHKRRNQTIVDSTKGGNITRKTRSPQYGALAGLARPQFGFGQLGLQYPPRISPALGLQASPALQSLGQFRGLIPQDNRLLPNTAGYRVPYNVQLARLLSTLNLLRARSELASVSPAARLAADLSNVYKSQRLKYDSIPLKPEVINQELGANALPFLLGQSAFSSPTDRDDDDEGDSDVFCSPNPCHHGAKCKNLVDGFDCICRTGFTGKRCKERNPCLPNPCEHDGDCTVSGTTFECSCALGWKGEKCEAEDRCHPNPCMNGGSCTELSDGHECTCMHGYRGKNCQDRSGSCSPNPCLNDGHCLETSSGFECICRPGYAGTVCTASQSKCLLNPCLNGGKCLETLSGTGYECSCPQGYKGRICEDMSPCQLDTCRNGGTCFESDTGYKCLCRSGFGGKSCEEEKLGRPQWMQECNHVVVLDVRHSCQADTCKNGARCIEHENGFKCVCSSGFKGLYCEDVDRCHPSPCQHDGECIETETGYKCRCQSQYKGTHCEDLDLCVPSPCKNGAQCLSYQGGFKCLCQPGYSSDTCQDKSTCEPNPCHNGGVCSQDGSKFKCSCKRGYTGDTCQMVDSCLSNPCQHGGTCNNVEGGFTCSCPSDYKGTYCNEKEPCHPNPCSNEGKCLSTSSGFVCRCRMGFKGDTCSDEDECEPNPCQNDGRCVGRYPAGGFNCECSAGYRGATCREKDPCHPDPCANNGVCTEIGGGFSCNCTLGHKGSTCSELDQCKPNPCQHGGVCREVVGGMGFVCQCISGYKGLRCEAKDQCHPNPCMHDGSCMEINDELGFLCNCSSGFRGSHCQDMDPCHPNPCANTGACIHTNDGSFVCNCSIGFKGPHCQERDLCKPNPCQFGNKCLQTGTDSYQCVKKVCDPNPCEHGRCIEVNDDDYQCACTARFTGKNCNMPDHCQPNPCMNGGTCVTTSSGGYKCACATTFNGVNCTDSVAQKRVEVPIKKVKKIDFCKPNPCQNDGACVARDIGFHCMCKKNFTGPHCEQERITSTSGKAGKQKVDYCSPSPCKNNGVCVQEHQGYSCVCKPGFTGFHCQVNQCDLNPCKNGLCVADDKAGYKCQCHKGFVGKHCDENYCVPNPCSNGGICVSVPNKGYQCKCRDGFNGPRCERSPCIPNPCTNGGTCLVFYTVYLCKCPRNYRGTKCEAAVINKSQATDVTPVKKAETSRPALHVLSPNYPKKASRCNPDPCKNTAVCLETIDGGYECFCRGEFSGPKCEDTGEYTYSSAPKFFPGKGEECKHCDRYAHCVGGHCICRDGYVGDGLDCWAESSHDRAWTCGVNPCANGGTCKPGVGKCVCRLGYIGEYCEEYCPPSVHLSFDKMSISTLLDDSGNDNNAVIANGAQITPRSGKCGSAVNLRGGDILLDGAHFANIPRKGITISTWIKLDTILGVQSIFDTVGSHSRHKDGQYHLEVDNGKIRWFHRNESHDTIFSVLTQPVLAEGVWTQVTVTYSSTRNRARVFVDGDMKAEEKGHGLLSEDWAGKTGIGKHQHEFGSRLLRGMVDEFYIFPGELPRLEILVLMRHCKVYFATSGKHGKQQKALARGSQSMFSPYSPGIQNYIHTMQNGYPPSEMYRTGVPALSRAYQQPSHSSDVIAKNLEQILDSFEEGDPSNRQAAAQKPRHQVQLLPQYPSRVAYRRPYQGNYQNPIVQQLPGIRAFNSLSRGYIQNAKLKPPPQASWLNRPQGNPMTRMRLQLPQGMGVGKPTGYQALVQGSKVLPSIRKGQPYAAPQSHSDLEPQQMQRGLTYSLNPPLSPPHGKVSAPSKMKSPITYLEGMFVPMKPSPEANFATSAQKTRVAGIMAYNQRYNQHPRQYLVYRKPPAIPKTATSVLNTWFKSALPKPLMAASRARQNIRPRAQSHNAMPLRQQEQQISPRLKAFGQQMNGKPFQRPWASKVQQVNPIQRAGLQGNYHQYPQAAYSRTPVIRPAQMAPQGPGSNKVSYWSLPIRVSSAPRYKGYLPSYNTNYGLTNNRKYRTKHIDTNRKNGLRTLINNKGSVLTGYMTKQNNGRNRVTSTTNNVPGQYLESLQGVLDNLQDRQRSAIGKKIDPSQYLAFKLKPGPRTTKNPKELYEPALNQLNKALQKLMGQRRVEFKPEQLKFVMDLLEKALEQLAPASLPAAKYSTTESGQQTPTTRGLPQRQYSNVIKFVFPRPQTQPQNAISKYTLSQNPRLAYPDNTQLQTRRTSSTLLMYPQYITVTKPLAYRTSLPRPIGDQARDFRYIADAFLGVLRRKKKEILKRKKKNLNLDDASKANKEKNNAKDDRSKKRRGIKNTIPKTKQRTSVVKSNT